MLPNKSLQHPDNLRDFLVVEGTVDEVSISYCSYLAHVVMLPIHMCRETEAFIHRVKKDLMQLIGAPSQERFSERCHVVFESI